MARLLLQRLIATDTNTSADSISSSPLPSSSLLADGLDDEAATAAAAAAADGSSSRGAMARARAAVNAWNARTGETALWLAVHEVN